MAADPTASAAGLAAHAQCLSTGEVPAGGLEAQENPHTPRCTARVRPLGIYETLLFFFFFFFLKVGMAFNIINPLIHLQVDLCDFR
jgi:hypothetical protein